MKMSDNMDDLKKAWKQGQSASVNIPSAAKMAGLALRRKREIFWFQFGNLISMSIVVTVLMLAFRYLFPVQETISRVAAGFMIGGLILRISLELYSLVQSRKIRLLDESMKNIENTISYFKLRKIIHGPVTYTVVILYVAGVYLLTPEFSLYVNLKLMLFFDVLFSISGVVLIFQIRKGIRKEMSSISELIDVRQDLNGL